MSYDFETLVKRGAGSLKETWTAQAIKDAGYVSFDAAEMDFATAPSILKSLRELVDGGIFGFNLPEKRYYERVCWWMRTVRGWEVEPDWIVTAMGMIFSVATMIRLTTTPEDSLIVLSPEYNRYAQAARRLGRGVCEVPLMEKDDAYCLDFEALEKAMAQKRNRLMVLSNPHNPTGRVWTRAELTELAKLSARYGVYVVSDEIFAEVTFDGHETTPYVDIPEARAYGITLTSLGKTFNFTGVNHANVIIPDENLRARFTAQRTADHYGSLEPFAYASILGAYTEEGLDWRNEMLAVVGENRRMIREAMAGENAPAKMFPSEGTFVCWLRFDERLGRGEALKRALDEKALFSLEPGMDFSPACDRFMRMSMGSTNRQTKLGLQRLQKLWQERQ